MAPATASASPFIARASSSLARGEASRVAARHCVLACNNAMIPYIAPELTAEQVENA